MLEWFDGRLEELEQQAAGPCIVAMTDWGDREAYREAMRRANGLQEVRRLRAALAKEVEQETEPAAKVKSQRRKAKQTG